MHAMSIDDAYRVERVLASGACGVTECVTIEGSGPFVRKRIPAERAHRGVWASLADCRCRFLPKVWATYEMPDQFVVVYDYVPGEGLEEYVAERGALSAAEAVRLAGTVCEAAQALHEHGIVHRDIAPQNVIVARDGAHLIDLGIAQIGDGNGAREEEHFGTWGFSAPEQYGFAETDARSDVYSLGRLLGYMLTGARPDDEAYERLLADGETEAPALRAVVERACAFEPSARYQSAAALGQALESALAASADGAGSGPESVAGQAGASEPAAGAGSAMPAEDAPAAAGVGAAAGARPWAGRAVGRRVAVAAGCAVLLGLGAVAVWHATGGGEVPAAEGGAPAVSAGGQAGDGADSDALLAQGGEVSRAAASALELVAQSWSPEPGGVVNYVFGIANKSGEFEVDYPEVVITGRDADGATLFSETMTLMAVLPGETVYFGGFAGAGEAPETVEFELEKPDATQLVASNVAESPFAVHDAREASDGAGGLSVTGSVAVEEEVRAAAGAGQVAVTAVLVDAAGRPVYGGTAFVDRPAVGEAAPFEVVLPNAPDHAAIEVYAQVW